MLDFGGGAISGDGGLLLPGRLDRWLALTRQAGKVLGGFETRQPGKIRHLASDMFRQRVLSLAAGPRGPERPGRILEGPAAAVRRWPRRRAPRRISMGERGRCAPNHEKWP